MTAMGELTCHILDTHGGKPAAGMRVDLAISDGEIWRTLKSVETTATGRTAGPLLAGEAMVPGAYRLEFYHADYFARQAKLADPPFYDHIVHFFAIDAADAHTHITLVASPWGYSTYRWKA